MKFPQTIPGLFMLAALAPFTLACEEEGLSLTLPEIETEPEAPASLQFETFILDLDTSVPPQSVTIRNTGQAPLLLEYALEGEDGSQFRISQGPSVLSPGQEDGVFVRFEPEVHEDMEADLVIRSNDPDEAVLRFPLTAQARERCQMTLEPSVVDMRLGETRTVELRSLSKSPCEVEFLNVTGGVFTFVEPPEVPFTVEPGEAMPLEVLHDGLLLTIGVPVGEVVARDRQQSRETAVIRGEAAVGGCVRFQPSRQVLFDRTPIGGSTTESFRISNTCERPVRIRNIAVTFGVGDFFIDESFSTSFELSPFQSVDVPVRFQPLIGGALSGRITIATTDVESLIYNLDLVGFGDPPIIDYFPLQVDFGAVKFRPDPAGGVSQCASQTRSLFVFSRGQAVLNIDSIGIESESDGDFQITGLAVLDSDGSVLETPSLGDPFSLPPQTRLEVLMQFFPSRTDPAPHTGTLRIEHDAEGGLTRVPLVGTAEPDQPVLERFDQPEGPKVDILWVIDDSCSMGDEQLRLIGNLSRFVDFADSQDSDYQMAVTVTDGTSSRSGRFERAFPFPAVIRDDYPEREAAFRETFQVGTAGSGIEAGLGAAKNALIRAQEEEPNINSGFLRDDAQLAIVLMSDEDDQSIESDPNLELFFRTVKGPGRESRTKIHAIAGPTTESCRNEEGRFLAAPGFRYERFTKIFGGNFLNICEDDWSPLLTQLGLDTFEPEDTWFLSQAADPATVRVFVNGAEVAQSATDGWTFNFSANAVEFNGTALPPPGARIEVRYDGLCAP